MAATTTPIRSRAFAFLAIIVFQGLCDSQAGRQAISEHAFSPWTEVRRIDAHRDAVSSVVFSPNGEVLASDSYDKTARLWEVRSGKLRGALADAGPGIAFSPDLKTAALASKGTPIKLLALPTGEVVRAVKGPTEWAGPRAYAPKGETLAGGGQDGRIRLWRVSDASLLRVFDAHRYPVSTLAFSRDGKYLASGGRDKTVRVWSASDGKSLQVLGNHAGHVMSLVFSTGGEMLASGDDTGAIHLWQTSDWKRLPRIWHGNPVLRLAFSPDGKLLAVCSTSDSAPAASLHLRRVSDGKELQILMHEMAEARCAAFSPDGKLLAAGCTDGTIRLFTPGGLKEEQEAQKVTATKSGEDAKSR